MEILPITEGCFADIEARSITSDPKNAIFDREILVGEVKRLQQEVRHTKKNLEQLRICYEILIPQ